MLPSIRDTSSWIEEHLSNIPNPSLIDIPFLNNVGKTLLIYKKKDQIIRNSTKYEIKLTHLDVANVLLFYCSFALLDVSTSHYHQIVGIQQHKMYITDHDVIYRYIRAVAPHIERKYVNSVLRHIKKHLAYVNIPIPPKDPAQSNPTSTHFWNQLKCIYKWDVLIIESLYFTYKKWFLFHNFDLYGYTLNKPAQFHEEINSLLSLEWRIQKSSTVFKKKYQEQ